MHLTTKQVDVAYGRRTLEPATVVAAGRKAISQTSIPDILLGIADYYAQHSLNQDGKRPVRAAALAEARDAVLALWPRLDEIFKAAAMAESAD